MSSHRRPWYPWYPKDFVVDEKVQALSPIAELLYRRALDVMWQANDCQLPSNCLKLANQLGKGLAQNEFEKAWSEIQFEGFELFKTTEDGKWIYSKRLKAEAEKIENIQKKRSRLGKKGAIAKAKAKAKQLPKQKHKQTVSHTDTDTYIKKNTKKKKKPLSESYQLELRHIDYAKKQGMDSKTIKSQFEDFCIHHRKKGNEFVSWYAAWQTWVRNHFKFIERDSASKDEHDLGLPGKRVM